MAAKHVFGKVRFTREEREAHRRIWEATKDEPSEEEFERRLGPTEPVEDMHASVFRSALGHRIGIAREDAGLTREGLAKLVGTDLETVSRLECGAKETTVDILARVLKALKFKVTIEPAGPVETGETGETSETGEPARPAEKKAADGARG